MARGRVAVQQPCYLAVRFAGWRVQEPRHPLGAFLVALNQGAWLSMRRCRRSRLFSSNNFSTVYGAFTIPASRMCFSQRGGGFAEPGAANPRLRPYRCRAARL